VSARIVVPYDTINPPPPPLAGVRVRVGYPGSVEMPTVAPGVPIIDPTRLTILTGVGGTLLGQTLDTDMNQAADTLDLLYAVTGTTFPPGNLVAARFTCPSGTSLSAASFTCVVTEASDRFGNTVCSPLQPCPIPCSVAALSAP
jgi:hypothetical protein